MQLYRVQITLKSPLVTSLTGDTIWGHIVCGIANHEGDSSVAEFLISYEKGEPPLVNSSAFPHDYLPKPLLNPTVHRNNIDIKQYSAIKKIKKQRYIPLSCFITKGFIFTPNSLLKILEDKSNLTTDTSNSLHMHNTINRFSNSVQEGGLYTTNEIWHGTNTCGSNAIFDIYVYSLYKPERILQLFNWAFENGYGADSSTGKGNITISTKIETMEFPDTGNRTMALGPFMIDDYNITGSFRADIFTKSGKIGGNLVGEIHPFKKTIVLYDAGAVFLETVKKPYIGKFIQNIHSDERIRHSALCPVISFTEGENE